ncbi:hypothetical protein Vretimale_18008 [Volvox reticuliferus]|uniref:RNA helicase n=1 Tax=Volvox reticuliferus TaxID=1737510 RepID=A0A8J4GW57_9CHLO|nr:hypothetical protein Vretifemale_17728 [Volvox reticuliferus]GIM15211.1 hypothetical protein Vretimale_18008 [Volvox reticuliferus]
MDPIDEEAVNVFIETFYARHSDATPGINFYAFKKSCSVFRNSPYAFIKAWFRARPETYTIIGQLVVPHGIAAELPAAVEAAPATAAAAIPAVVMAALTKTSPSDPVNLHCSICRIRCTSEDNMREHIRGARHRNAVLAAEPQQLEKVLRSLAGNQAASRCRHCEICGRWFTNPDLFRDHVGSSAHKARIYWILLRRSASLKQQGATCSSTNRTATEPRVVLSALPQPLPAVAPNTTARHKIIISNLGPGMVKLRSVFFLTPVTDGSMRLEYSCGVTDPRVRTDVWIDESGFHEVTLVIEPKWLGLMRNLIIFDLAPTGPMVLPVAGSCCPPDMPAPPPPGVDAADGDDQQQKKQPPRKLKRVNPDIVDGIPPPGYDTSTKTPVKMQSLTVPEQLRSLVERADWEKLRKLVPPRRDVPELGQAEYAKRLQQLLWLEELQHEIDIQWYDMKDATLNKLSRSHLLALEVPGLAENRPSVLKGDRVLVSPSDGSSHGREYAGYVHVVEKEEVHLCFADSFLRDVFLEKRRFNVRFTVNRSAFNLMQNALVRAGKSSSLSPSLVLPGIDPFMLPAGLPFREPPGGDICLGRSGGPLVWQHKDLNAEQRLAVREVLRGAHAPLPYLIFGPPGTGKTSTLVEAAKQLLLTSPSSRLLLVAPSNSAADLLIQSLASTSGAAATRTMSQRLGPGSCHMMRLCAYSRPLKSLPRDLKEQAEDHGLKPLGKPKGHVAAVNWDSEHQAFLVPPLEMLMDPRLRVVVATCVTAARLVHAGVPGGRFSHILVDEAGHAEEPLLMCSLAGLAGAKSGVRVVMAGDPKQLGPIILSLFAKKYGGLDVSLMERLLDASDGPYIRQIGNSQQPTSGPVLGSYPSAYITKLLQNYRSHPDILRVPNAIFYDNELVPAANTDIINSMLQWEGLPNPRVPMMMHHIVGKDTQAANSPSWQNDLECLQVTRGSMVDPPLLLPSLPFSSAAFLNTCAQQLFFWPQLLLGAAPGGR